MPVTYKKRIRDYCDRNGIVVPSGFDRHPANRYAVVDFGKSPPRLVATTWFKKEDMLYYVNGQPQPQTLKTFDFKETPDSARAAGGGASMTTPVQVEVADRPEAGAALLSPNTLALVDAMFAADQRVKVRRLLEEQCGRNLPFLDGLNPYQLERYRFAAIKVSQGRLEALLQAIQLAKVDWRDLLMQADFGHDVRAHESWCATVIGNGGQAS